MFFSFPTAEQITNFTVTQEDENQRPRGLKLCYSLFGWYYWLSWIILIAITGAIAAWIWLYYEIYLNPNHTFAWQTLLRSFGSAYRLQCFLNGNDEDKIVYKFNITESQTNYQYLDFSWMECLPISYSIPCIPIISMIILSVIVISGVACLLPVTMSVFDGGVGAVRANIGWQFFYSLIAIIMVSIYFDADSNALDDIMRNSWKSQISRHGQYKISKTWNITQTVDACCGYTSYTEYDNILGGIYPSSCCNNQISNCRDTEPLTAQYVWKQGCYIVEYNRVIVVGGFEIFLLMFQFLLSICLYYLVYMSNLEEHEKIARGFYFRIESDSLPLIFPRKPYD